MHTRFYSGNMKKRYHLKDPRLRWEDNIEMDVRKVAWGHGLDRSGSG